MINIQSLKVKMRFDLSSAQRDFYVTRIDSLNVSVAKFGILVKILDLMKCFLLKLLLKQSLFTLSYSILTHFL